MKDEVYLVWTTLAFYLFLFFNLNNKTLVAFFFIYLFVLYFFNKDFRKSLLLVFLASLPFNVGKTYVIELVPAWQLGLSIRPYGIASNIIISIKEVLIVIMFIFLIRDFFSGKKRVFKIDRISMLLLFYFLSLIIASIAGSIRPEISLIYSLYSIESLILYFYAKELIRDKKDILLSSFKIFSSIIFLEVIISIIQFIKRSPLGISIEESSEFLPIDPSLEATALDYRPVGTFSHANWLANFLLLFLFIFLPSLFLKFKSQRKTFLFTFLSAFLVFLLTLSRSAWFSFFVSFLLFLFIVEKKWNLRLKITKELLKLFFLISPFLLLFVIFFLFPRIINTFYSFEVYGGGYTRIQLIKETIETIREFPFFGVGLGMSIFYSYINRQTNISSIFSYFPEAVHNGFLFLIVQVGIFSFLFFAMLCFFIFKNLIEDINREKNSHKRILLLSLLLGFFSLFLNAFLQPFIPSLQNLVFLSMIYTDRKNLEELI